MTSLTMTRVSEQGPKGLYLQKLRRNATKSLRPGAEGLALQVVSGLMVVTQEGDPRDHELRPGDVFRTTSRGLLVAWALSDGSFTVNGNSLADLQQKAA